MHVLLVNKDGSHIDKSNIPLLSAFLDLIKQYHGQTGAIWCYLRFFKLRIFRTNFHFPWRFEKSEFHCITGKEIDRKSKSHKLRNPEVCNPESRGLESGIQRVGIRNPDDWNPESRGWSPESRGLESGIQWVESGIQRVESGIQRVGIRNPEGWNPESRGLESGIQRVESGIQMIGIQNPEGWNPESRGWNPESNTYTSVNSVTWGKRNHCSAAWRYEFYFLVVKKQQQEKKINVKKILAVIEKKAWKN